MNTQPQSKPQRVKKAWPVDVVFPVETGAYGAADVLPATPTGTVRAVGVCRFPDVPVELVQWSYIDADFQTAAVITAYFLTADVLLGVTNAGITITDANARDFLTGVSPIGTGGVYSLIGSRMGFVTEGNQGPPSASAHVPNLPQLIRPINGTKDVYIGLTTSGSPTFASGSIAARFWFRDVGVR